MYEKYKSAQKRFWHPMGIPTPGNKGDTLIIISSDACETALKIARQYWQAAGEPKRTKFISLRNAYHGVHMGASRWAASLCRPRIIGPRCASCWTSGAF